MRFIIYISALLLLLATSCQKVIDLPVNDTEPKLVIEGKYDAIKEKVSVKISKTINVFSADDFPIVTGAQIEIYDKNGVATPLVDQGDGSYLLENYTPTFNAEYTLKVNVEGETYKASDTLMPVVELDSLTTELQPSNSFTDGGYVLFMHLTDPVGPNFYRAIRKVNGEYKKEVGDQFMFDDALTEGNSQKVPMFSELYQVEDTVQIELVSYSENSFEYYQELKAIASNSGASAAPANPSPTWAENVLGHFVAYGYDTKIKVIEE